MKDSSMDAIILSNIVEKKIFSIRGLKVMVDSDLADLYGVETKYLKRVVKRNLNRFPPHFMFELSSREHENLRCQFVTSKLKRHGGHRYQPYVLALARCSRAISPQPMKLNGEAMSFIA